MYSLGLNYADESKRVFTNSFFPFTFFSSELAELLEICLSSLKSKNVLINFKSVIARN